MLDEVYSLTGIGFKSRILFEIKAASDSCIMQQAKRKVILVEF